jgi:hypothetical protein
MELIFCYAVYLLWMAFIHQIRGARLTREARDARGINFSTNTGDFRIDKAQHNFKYRLRKETNWKVLSFDAIRDISYYIHDESAGWFEFFLSDWSLWDLNSKYRDVHNVATIELSVAGGGRVPLVEIRQYEQREMWLGHYSYLAHIWLLKKLHLFHPLEEAAEAWAHDFIYKCRRLGLVLLESDAA